jgi:ParB family chromosome partitioning protein
MQNSSAFQYLAVDTIHEPATNPWRTFDESKLQELAESIRHYGFIQPITVRPNSDGFELIAGARRYRAAILAELFSIPARMVEIDDAQALEWQLVGKFLLDSHLCESIYRNWLDKKPQGQASIVSNREATLYECSKIWDSAHTGDCTYFFVQHCFFPSYDRKHSWYRS